MEFDGWAVNRISGEMTRNGRASRLPQQPLRILIELYDHAGKIVTREQLVKALWPQGIVDFDNGLNVAVRKLRVALDDVADVPRYIETMPKVGYRFIVEPGAPAGGPVHEATTGLSRRAQLTMLWGIAGLAIAIGASWWFSMFGPDGPNGFADELIESAAGPATARPRHVPSPRAQELYVEGMHERSRRDIDATVLAVAKLEAAIREDPEYAEAWAGYSRALMGAVVRQTTTPAEGLPKIRAAAERALALDPTVADAHVTVIHLHMDFDKDFAAAGRDLENVRRLGIQSAGLWHYSAYWHAQQGRVEEGLADMRRARALEPMTLLLSSNYALILFNARRYDEVIGLLNPIVEANPGFDTGRSVLARALTATGRFDEALAQLQARDVIGAWQGDLGVLYAKRGRRDDALREIARLEALQAQGFGESYELATIHATLGDLDRGCELLARSLTDHSFMMNWMRLDPRMDPLRGRQCFADVEKTLYGK